MTFTPGARQKVEIADIIRPIASNLRNVADACDQTAMRFVALAPEAQAEVSKICTVERFLEIQAAAQSIRDELDAGILSYEGESGLPVASKLTDGLVAFWPMNEESGDRADLVNGYALSEDGDAVGSTPGHIYDNALEFVGNDRTLSRAYDADELWNLNETSFTVAYWVKASEWPWEPINQYMGVIQTGVSLAYDYDPPGYTGWQVQLPGNNASAFGCYQPGLATFSHSTLQVNDAWTLIVHVQDIDAMQLKSSRNAATWADVAELAGEQQSSARALELGHNLGVSPVYALGPVMLWSRALTQAEVTTLYNSGDGLTHEAMLLA